MISADAPLQIVRISPYDLLMDHTAHGMPLDACHLDHCRRLLDEHPDQDLDPVIARRDDAGRLWVTNGRHRVLAAQLERRVRIPVVVEERADTASGSKS